MIKSCLNIGECHFFGIHQTWCIISHNSYITRSCILSLGYYRDCKQAFELGETCSGVYTIKPENTTNTFAAKALPPFDVYCDMDIDGGGWTVFQRRINGTQNFYLDWADYVRGFGDLNGEFWLGLSNMHRLTIHTTLLRIDLADFDGDVRFAKYTPFQVGDSDSKYTLTVSGYNGNAGDALTRHSGHAFSTKDRDNDVWDKHCAQVYKGGWWYDVCHESNLNGLYLYGHHPSFADGVNWRQWKDYHYSLKATEMKVRRY